MQSAPKPDRRRRLKYDPANCKGTVRFVDDPTDEELMRANRFWAPIIRKMAGLEQVSHAQ